MAEQHGIWEGLRDRWEFATQNDEQRFQTKLYSDRRLYNQILSYPSNYIQNRLLRPDLKPKGWFDQAAAFTFVDKWLFGSVAGMVARSMTSGYTKHENYTRAKEAATGLAGMAMAAEAFDEAPSHLSDEIAAGQESLVNTLFSQSAEAGHVLEQFISGKLEITPKNLERLNTLLEGLSELSAKRADMLEGYASLAQAPQTGKPSSYIREAVEKPQLQTPRDAQVFLGFVSALLVDSAVPFSSEIFIPQDEQFLTEDQNKELSKAISARLEQLGYITNEAADGAALPAPDAPEGVLLKKSANGYAPLSQQEVLGFAQELHGQLQQLMGKDMSRILDFADARYHDIENTLANRKAAKAATIVTPEITAKASEQVAAAAPATVQSLRNSFEAERDVLRLGRSAKNFMQRPHVGNEISKLWGRSISNQIMAFPVNIFDEVLRNFFRTSKEGQPKAGFDVLMDRVRGNKDSEMGKLFDAEAFQNNLKSRGFRFFSQSLIGSVGVVGLQQSTRVGAMLAVDAAERSDPIISAAIRQGQKHVPEFAERVQKVKGQHPSIAALMQHPDYANIPALLQGKQALNADEFRTLSKFFHEMSQVSVNMAEEVLSPFQKDTAAVHKVQSMDEVAARLFSEPIANVPDAMMALAFAQSFMQLSKDKIEMIEYVDPKAIFIQPKELKKMGYFIEDEAKRQGLSVQEVDGQPQLVGKDGKPADAQAIIALGQATIGKLNSLVNVNMLLGAAKGEFRDEVVEQMEHRLFEGVTFATQGQDAAAQPTAQAAAEPWAEKVHRPTTSPLGNVMQRWKHPEVKHEKQKLFDRLQGEKLTSTVSTLIQKSLQHQNSIFDRGNLIYTAWTYAAYPTLYGKGIVNVREVWDELLFRKRSMLNDAEQGADVAAAAVMAAGQAQPDLKTKLSDFMTGNMLVDEMQQDFHTRDIARIAAKPRAERSEQDNAAMESYFAGSGDKMLQLTGNLLSELGGNGGKETFREVIERVCEQPVNNLGDAVAGLSFLASVMQQDATYLDRQMYVDPKNIMMRKDELKALGGFMSDQAYAAGFVVNGQALPGSKQNVVKIEGVPEGTLLQKGNDGHYAPAPQESIIRYANVALGKFRDIRAQSPEMQKSFSHMLREDKQQRAVLAAKEKAAVQLG